MGGFGAAGDRGRTDRGRTDRGTTGGSQAMGSSARGAETAPGQESPGQGMQRGHDGVNVSKGERVLSAALGTMLAARGLRRRSLGGALIAAAGGSLLYRGVTGHCGVYEKLGFSSNRARWKEAGAPPDAMEIKTSITVQRSAQELYELWREPQTLSRILKHFVEVEPAADGLLSWRYSGPLGIRREWRTRTVATRPGESIGWQSLPGSQLPIEGRVRFKRAPADRGTEVELQVRMDPRTRTAGVATLFGFVPRLLFSHALRSFKSLAETGEVPSVEHNPSGREAREPEREPGAAEHGAPSWRGAVQPSVAAPAQ